MKHYLFIFLFVFFSSCTDYDAEPFTGKVLPRVTGYSTGVTNDWLYINLRTGEMFNRNRVNEDIVDWP